MNNGNAIVLGGTDDHRHLIQLLHGRGYRVVLVDFLSHPIAKDASDEHVQADAFNPQVVTDIARQYDAQLVIAACIDQAMRVACQVSEHLSLPAPFSADVASTCSNKLLMKRLMLSAGIPCARFIEVSDGRTDSISDLTMPVVVKPADSHGSWGVRSARNINEAATHIQNAVGISRSGQAIVEEFIAGDEISIDAVITGDKSVLLACSQLWRWQVDHSTRVICQTETSADLLDRHRQSLECVVNKIAATFGLNNTPLLIQGIVGPQGLSVVEFAPRVGGGSKYCDVLQQTGIDLVGLVIDSYLGVPIQVLPAKTSGVHTRTFVYGKQGAVARYSGFSECISDGLVSDVRLYKNCGEEVAEVLASKDRLASFRVMADSVCGCAEIVAQVAERIDVTDQDGQSLVKKEWMLGPWV